MHRTIRREQRWKVPAILAAAMTVLLAVRPAAAQDVRLTRVAPDRLEITGGSGPATWRLQYGTPVEILAHPIRAEIFPASDKFIYFSHDHWLRLIDAGKGIEVGRWHFPGVVVGLVPAGTLVQVQLENKESGQSFTRTVTFDPSAPVVPFWPLSGYRCLNCVARAETAALFSGRGRLSDSTAPLPAAEARALLPDAQETVRRDPLSPWLRIALGKIQRDSSDPRASATFDEAVQVPSTDFTELFPISAYLDELGEPRAARAAFERAYQDYLERGNDPRLFTVLIGRLVLYAPFKRGLTRTDPMREELIERLYRLSPASEGTDLAWQSHADYFEKSGRPDQARLWRARAEDARTNSLHGFTTPLLIRVDRLWLIAAASVLASLLWILALYAKYRPQRRLALAARHTGVARRFGFFNLEYWSRRERLALFIIVLAGWFADGLVGGYGRAFLRFAAEPVSLGMGSLAGPSNAWYLETQLPATPERDLLRAIAHQQDGEPTKAERLYRALPDFAESWNNLGVMLKTTGKGQEARQAFERALQLDPGLAEAALNAGRPPESLWTELHQKYLPGRPMIAPPRRDHLLRAFFGGSPASLYLRALGGPFAGSLEVNLEFDRLRELAFLLTGAMAVAIALLLLIPSRDVTQAPGKMHRVSELLLPGVSPSWRVLGGPVLLAWTYLLLEMGLRLKFGTPFLVTRLFTVRSASYGIPSDAIERLINPSWFWAAGAAALLVGMNLLLTSRARRARESTAG